MQCETDPSKLLRWRHQNQVRADKVTRTRSDSTSRHLLRRQNKILSRARFSFPCRLCSTSKHAVFTWLLLVPAKQKDSVIHAKDGCFSAKVGTDYGYQNDRNRDAQYSNCHALRHVAFFGCRSFSSKTQTFASHSSCTVSCPKISDRFNDQSYQHLRTELQLRWLHRFFANRKIITYTEWNYAWFLKSPLINRSSQSHVRHVSFISECDVWSFCLLTVNSQNITAARRARGARSLKIKRSLYLKCGGHSNRGTTYVACNKR